MTSADFFKIPLVYNFISESFRFTKNKQTVITHLSEILKVTNMNISQDFRLTLNLDSKFSLHNLPQFKLDFCPQKIHKQKKSKSFVHFNSDNFLKLLTLHQNFDHSFQVQNFSEGNLCRAVFMCLTGVRFANTLDLVQNTRVSPKSCLKCTTSTCEFFSPACFETITFFETKTVNSHSCILLPFAKRCFISLSSDLSNTTFNYNHIYDNFENFLKTEFQCTSHKIRKFLPNLLPRHLNSCNTGAWTSRSKTLENFYLSDHYKYFLAHNLILDFLGK